MPWWAGLTGARWKNEGRGFGGSVDFEQDPGTVGEWIGWRGWNRKSEKRVGDDYLQSRGVSQLRCDQLTISMDGGAAAGQGSPTPTTVPAGRMVHHLLSTVAAGWVGRLAVDLRAVTVTSMPY